MSDIKTHLCLNTRRSIQQHQFRMFSIKTVALEDAFVCINHRALAERRIALDTTVDTMATLSFSSSAIDLMISRGFPPSFTTTEVYSVNAKLAKLSIPFERTPH